MARRRLNFQYDREQDEFVIRIDPEGLGIFPEETRGHIREANKELLLAARSFLDRMIERNEEREQKGSRRRKVQVTRRESESATES